MKKHPTRGGYIALMATIIISLILLVMVANQAFVGSYARFNVLGVEAKEESATLAEGCARLAIAKYITVRTYVGDEIEIFEGGECAILTVLTNEPSSGMTTVRSSASVRGSVTNLEVVLNSDLAQVSAREVPSF